MFYSNCLIEALKAKLKNPRKVKITFVPKSEKGSCHFMWSDGEADYDFGVERNIKWYEVLWFKGEIRKRSLGFNKKYKEKMSRSKHPKYKGFTKYYGWCDMYWNDKCVNCPNFHNCHRGHNTRATWRARKRLVKKFTERLKAPIIDREE